MNTALPEIDVPRQASQELSEHPPLSVRIAAAICIVAGTGALVNMVVALLCGRIWINLGFIAIPIGRGLLKGLRSSRIWATIFSCVFLIALFLSGAAAVSDWLGLSQWMKESGERPAPSDKLLLAGSCVAVCVSSGFVFFALRTSAAKVWCSMRGGQERTPGLDWSLPLFIAALGPAIFLELSVRHLELSHREFVRSLFHFEVDFKFHDAITGKPAVHSISTSGVAGSTADEFSPQVTYASSLSADGGIGMKLSGLSDRPLPFTFSTEGRKPVRYTIDQKTPNQVVLTFDQNK